MAALITTGTMSGNGRIIIPAIMRDNLHLHSGDKFTIKCDEKGIHIKPLSQSLAEMQELYAKHIAADISLVDELIQARREDAAKE